MLVLFLFLLLFLFLDVLELSRESQPDEDRVVDYTDTRLQCLFNGQKSIKPSQPINLQKFNGFVSVCEKCSFMNVRRVDAPAAIITV